MKKPLYIMILLPVLCVAGLLLTGEDPDTVYGNSDTEICADCKDSCISAQAVNISSAETISYTDTTSVITTLSTTTEITTEMTTEVSHIIENFPIIYQDAPAPYRMRDNSSYYGP